MDITISWDMYFVRAGVCDARVLAGSQAVREVRKRSGLPGTNGTNAGGVHYSGRKLSAAQFRGQEAASMQRSVGPNEPF